MAKPTQQAREQHVKDAVWGSWEAAFTTARVHPPGDFLMSQDRDQLTLVGVVDAILEAESEVGADRGLVRCHWQVRALADQVAECIADREGSVDEAALRRADEVVDVLVEEVYRRTVV